MGLGLRTKPKIGEGRLGEGGLWDPQEIWVRAMEGLRWCSVAGLGTRLGGWAWGNREKGDLRAAF